MSSRKTWLHLAAKTLMLFGALFVVTVLIAAIPAHRPPLVPGATEEQQSAGSVDSSAQEMPGMDMSDAKASERQAVSDMTPGAHDAHGAHMTMTAMRAQTPADIQRAKEIAVQLRAGIEKYKDYHAALADGFRIFLPNVPQTEYHFTKYGNGFWQAFTFDPARPTSLLYRKTGDGYELVGAMYTMPKSATEEQLNARVPLSVAMWHLHTNLCLPPRAELRDADFTKFGLKGSITTREACDAANGRFQPVIFGWMVHVYPYESSLDKIFAMHHHMD
ncbi:MAG TPA: hypothetical protein VGI16_14305 [Candidatus Acidoferrum sp.]|jgi:hypothetical protein